MNMSHEGTTHEGTTHDSASSEQKMYTEEEHIAAIREAKRKQRNRIAWAIALITP